jgi:hypothetical protein
MSLENRLRLLLKARKAATLNQDGSVKMITFEDDPTIPKVSSAFLEEPLITIEVQHAKDVNGLSNQSSMDAEVRKAISAFKQTTLRWPFCTPCGQAMEYTYTLSHTPQFNTSVYFACDKCGKMGRQPRKQGLEAACAKHEK